MGLKSIAKKVFGKEDLVDEILAMPLIGLRIELKKAFQRKSFTQEQYVDFVDRLSRLKGEDIEAQRKLADSALANRKVDSSLDIDLSSPEKQLLWAAALTRMMEEGSEPIVHSGIWKQLLDTSTARNEMIMTGRVVYASLQNDDTAVSWGQPGSWFYFDPLKNRINLDFHFSLMMGFEHIRSINLHEIGHSQLSNKYSPRMQVLYEKLKEYIDPTMTDSPEKMAKHIDKVTHMSEAEQKELALVSKEWELRFDLWHMVEDNAVDQFATHMSDRFPQDFGYSKNVMFTALQGFGELARGDNDDVEISSDQPRREVDKMAKEIEDKKKELEGKQQGSLTKEQQEQYKLEKELVEGMQKNLEEQIKQIRKAVEFESRPLTDKEVKDIAKGDISPELARKMFKQMKTAVLVAFYTHNGLFEGTDENWERFRIFPADVRRVIDAASAQSGEKTPKDSFAYLVDLSAGPRGINTLQPQTHDHFFGKDRYRAKVSETTDARIKVMDHIWDLYLDRFAKVLLKEFEKKVEQEMKQGGKKGKTKPGQGQGQGQPGQGQPGQGQPGQGQPGQGQGGGESSQQPFSESLREKMKNMQATPEDKRQSEQSAPGAGGSEEDADGAKPGEDKKPGGGKGWEQDPEADKDKPADKVGDLRQQDPIDEKMTEEEKQALKDAAKAMAKAGQGGGGHQAGKNRGIDLAKLAKGDWKDFNRRVLELSPVINAVAEALKQIRAAQKKTVMQRSKNLNFTAEDGDVMGRLDRDKALETKRREVMHLPMQVDDFKKIRQDAKHVDESTIEFFQLIDGSGSMPGLVLTGTTTAMEAALQSAVIMYMACRKAGIDAYIMMWGDPDPLIIATPDSDLKKVGELLETLRKGTGSGTSLDPALKKGVNQMSVHKSRNGTISGSSHMQVYSDGDIADSAAAQATLEIIARNGKNLTVDVAVLRPPGQSGKTAMENVIEAVINTTHVKTISVMRGHDANVVPKELAHGLLKRVRRIEIKSEPDSIKRKRLKNLHRKMTT